MFKKSSKKPTMDRGNKNKKLTWLKILLNNRLERMKANPPPLGLTSLCELLWLGISGIIFLKGLIKNLVNIQLNKILKNRIKNIFKIWY